MLSCKTNDLFSHSCLLKCCSQGVASSPVHRLNKSVMYLLSLSLHRNICTPLHYCCPYRQLNAFLLFPVLNKPLSHVSFFFLMWSRDRFDRWECFLSHPLFNMTSNQHFNSSYMWFYLYQLAVATCLLKQACCIRNVRFRISAKFSFIQFYKIYLCMFVY